MKYSSRRIPGKTKKKKRIFSSLWEQPAGKGEGKKGFRFLESKERKKKKKKKMSQQPSYTPPAPSFLSRNVFFPLYDRAVLHYPRWWTPNAITVFGIACTMTASLLLLVSSSKAELSVSPTVASTPLWTVLPFAARVPSEEEFIARMTFPSWLTAIVAPILSLVGITDVAAFMPKLLLFIAGLLNLVYTFADNTDGRHARRTKQSSFTGEYLDHGLDCVTSLMSTYLLMAVLGIPLTTCAVALLLVAFATNLSHIVNHEQDIMIWGNEYFTVDEGMLLFGFGMWVPILFPAAPSLAVPALVRDFIPFLATFEVRYVDIVLCCLLLGQIDIMWTLSKRDFSVWVRPTTLAMAANTVVMFLASRREADLPAAVTSCSCFSLSYPALWLITAACTSSLICHIPIVGKCLGTKSLKARCDHTPIGAAIVLWLVFWSHPVCGTALAVAVHALQVLFNLQRITAKKQGKKI